MSVNELDKNVPIAFTLVICAGISTALGAGIVFCKNVTTLANKTFLAASLGISGGVMAYVSLIEIFQKGVGAFASMGMEPGHANAYATLCFFGGLIVTHLLHLIVHCFDDPHGSDVELHNIIKVNEKQLATDIDHPSEINIADIEAALEPVDSESTRTAIVSPVTLTPASGAPRTETTLNETSTNNSRKPALRQSSSTVSLTAAAAAAVTPVASNVPSEDSKKEDPAQQTPPTAEERKLKRMGIMTAIAIGLHNFPEGLATFVGALSDPKVGVALAVAIGIHNIPEGLCVAIPVFYATKSRSKAFCWALLSGVSEPLGALLGYLVLRATMGPATYAVLFSAVAGMMTYIVFKELLPTAHRYDPDDKVTSASTFLGMAIMALSLVLFGI